MRNYNSIFELRNSLTGVMTSSTTVAATMQGIAIDTIGFQDMLGVLCVGALSGSGATDAGADLTVKFQHCATIDGTFTDITSGAINGTASVYGSAKFDVLSLVAGSAEIAEPLKQRKLYLQLNNTTTERYIWAKASITGTTGQVAQWSVSVAVLMGKARESSSIIDAVSAATTAFYASGWAGGSVPGLF